LWKPCGVRSEIIRAMHIEEKSPEGAETVPFDT
jgi:hypothetical protein